MIRFFTKYFLFLSILLLIANSLPAENDSIDQYKVYLFNIKEMIAPPVWRTTKLAIENAKDSDADLILIHMNTYQS